MSHGSHEKTDANAKPLVIFAVIMVLFIIVAMAFCAIYFRSLDKVFNTDLNAYKATDIHGSPKLQINNASDLHHFENSQNELLNSYGWVNKASGVARVPIERAMGFLLSRNELTVAEN